MGSCETGHSIPAISTAIAGCEHEHIGTYRLCERHLQRLTDGEIYCAFCLAADGHLCVLLGREVAEVTS